MQIKRLFEIVYILLDKKIITAVTARASGNFEGSPASLDFYFTLKNEKIASLRCQ